MPFCGTFPSYTVQPSQLPSFNTAQWVRALIGKHLQGTILPHYAFDSSPSSNISRPAVPPQLFILRQPIYRLFTTTLDRFLQEHPKIVLHQLAHGPPPPSNYPSFQPSRRRAHTCEPSACFGDDTLIILNSSTSFPQNGASEKDHQGD